MTDELINWWQHLPTHMNPVLFQIGGFRIQYYGLMYLIAFGVTYALVSYRINTEKDRFQISKEQNESLATHMILGVVIGGRLGYVLFYNLSYYARHPLEIIIPFDFSNGITFTGISGMSYHGGLMGVIFFSWLFAAKNKLKFKELADLYAPAAPLGYTFGRLGNFINGELYGRVTDSAVGMYFPIANDHQLRHPSQLYEAFFEGIFLFAILWAIKKRVRLKGAMLALYIIGYGSVRFFIEFFRQPDAHIGFVYLFFSAGQILCIFMILCGILMYYFLWRAEKRALKA